MKPSTEFQKPKPLSSGNMKNLIKGLTPDEQRSLSKLLQKWDQREERKHERFRCSLMTDYEMAGEVHREMMTNICVGGAYIEGQNPPAAGQRFLQTFHIPNSEIPIRSKSRVIWISKSGFGVEFSILMESTPRVNTG